MASTPELKVYNSNKEYIGCLKQAEDAACVCASYGTGATIRYRHKHIVWSEGSEEFSAGESYDRAAKVIYDRIDALWAKGRQQS